MRSRIKPSAPAATKTVPERLLPWVALLGALTGAAFSGVQFLEAKNKDRIDRVFGYVSEFKTESMMKSHAVVQAVSDSITQQYQRYLRQLARDNSLSAVQKRRLKTQFYFEAYIGTYQRSPEFSDAMGRLSLFYEEVAICAQQQLCDATTARSFFQQGASDFLDNTKPILCEQRLVWNDQAGAVIAPAQQKFFKQAILSCQEWVEGS